MFDHASRALLPAAALVVLGALPGCGGATPQGAQTPCPSAAPVTAAEPKSDPAPFEGTFELLSGTDGKSTVDFRRTILSNAHDGKILWSLEGGSFSLGVWMLGSYKDPGDPDGELFSLCRGQVKVPVRFEGTTVVLPGALDVQGFSTAIRVEKKRDAAAGKTTTRTWTKDNNCSAQIAAKRIELKVLEKDAQGPVKLEASVEGGTFQLQRATAIDKLDVKVLVQTASLR
jgi:hypothetical protein